MLRFLDADTNFFTQTLFSTHEGIVTESQINNTILPIYPSQMLQFILQSALSRLVPTTFDIPWLAYFGRQPAILSMVADAYAEIVIIETIINRGLKLSCKRQVFNGGLHATVRTKW